MTALASIDDTDGVSLFFMIVEVLQQVSHSRLAISDVVAKTLASYEDATLRIFRVVARMNADTRSSGYVQHLGQQAFESR